MTVHRRRIDQETRRMLWERENRRCGYCGSKIGFGEVTIDHKIPLSRGGPDCPDNMICSCYGCNSFKGNRTIEEFRKIVQGANYELMQKAPEYRSSLRFGLIREYKKKKVLFHFEILEARQRRAKCKK